MKSLASLVLFVALPAAAQQPPPTDRPSGSSQASPGERRFDEVGRAEVFAGLATAVRGLEAGDLVEITALGTGRTVLARVTSGSTELERLATLSPATAAALDLSGDRLVRVRRAVADPQDIAALNRGDVVRRPDAPAALLVALRRLAPVPAVATPPAPEPRAQAAKPVSKPVAKPVVSPPKVAPPRPSTPPAAARPAPAAQGRYIVQVAALSNAASAQALARKLGGSVSPAGKFHRVRLGPFVDRASAEKARARAVAAGYRDSNIQTN